MNKFGLCLLILLISCGQSDPYFDPILEPYVRDFEDYMGITIKYDVLYEEVENYKHKKKCRWVL